MMLFAFASFSNAQCPAPNVISAKVETNGGTGFEFKIQADGNANFFNVEFKKQDATQWTSPDRFKCIGTRHYISSTNDTYTVTVPKEVAALYGFKKGDDVRVVAHCGIINTTLTDDCLAVPTGNPTATYTLKFKGN